MRKATKWFPLIVGGSVSGTADATGPGAKTEGGREREDRGKTWGRV